MDSINVRRYPEGKAHHESCRPVHNGKEVRGDGGLCFTARCKAYQIGSIMFMSGDFGGQWRTSNSEECSRSHLVATFDVCGVALFCRNRLSPSECTHDMNGCKCSERMLTYRSLVKDVMAEVCDVGTEVKEDRTFCVAGLQLPMAPPFSREGAARALMLRPHPNDVILSSYPRCDSPLVDSMVWKLLYTDVEHTPFDSATSRSLPCLEMATGGHLSGVHDSAADRKLPRVYKTYFPFRLIPFCRLARYIYVIRAPWEACPSYYRFLASIGAFDGTFDEFLGDFLEGDVPYGSYFRHVSLWNKRVGEGNILILCREQVEHNPRSALFKIAAFLGDQCLSRLLDDDELGKFILGNTLDMHMPSTTLCGVYSLQEHRTQKVEKPVCSEVQLNEILKKVSHHFGNSSIEFLWMSLFRKQLLVLVG